MKIDKILNYLYLNQREDGSWPYACDIEYTDSFHTAFILEAIIIMREQVDNPKYKKTFFSVCSETHETFMFFCQTN